MGTTVEEVNNFEIIQGDTFELELDYTDDENNPIDISDYTFVMEVRDKPGSKILSAQCSIGDGITITDGPNGIVDIQVSSEKTKKIPYPRAAYQIQATDPYGVKTTFVQGWFVVNPGVIQ